MKLTQNSTFEIQFALMLDELQIKYIREYSLTCSEMEQLPVFMQSHIKRSIGRFRYDFMLPEYRIIFEIEGGIFSGGRHINGVGYIKDRLKYLIAHLCRYTVISIPTDWFKEKRTPKQTWHRLIYSELEELLTSILIENRN